MAIGSIPEYGTKFSTKQNWTDDDWKNWRLMVGDDLVGGYATVVYISREDRERNLQVYALRHETESADGPAGPSVAHVQSEESGNVRDGTGGR